jgi:hypothetical protein
MKAKIAELVRERWLERADGEVLIARAKAEKLP